jgi:isopenicillin N synthase-like dioxygenase
MTKALIAVDYQAKDAKQAFVKSLRETGFGVLKNHPIMQQTVADIYTTWQVFF